MFGRRKGSDGTAKTGSATPPVKPAADSGGPRMYRPDIAIPPVPRTPVADAPGRPTELAVAPSRHPDVRPSAPAEVESKMLVVGRDIALAGEIRSCNRLIVEGRVEATLSDSRSIEVATTGVFKGKAQIESAEISGRFEGDLVVTLKLIIHSTGRVHGKIRYGQIEIARGGTISGQIETIEGGGPDNVPPTTETANGMDAASIGAGAAGS